MTNRPLVDPTVFNLVKLFINESETCLHLSREQVRDMAYSISVDVHDTISSGIECEVASDE